MNQKEEEFFKRLQAIFRVEAEEHISVLSSGLIELEKKPENHNTEKLIESVYREVHSLKGAARSVERSDIESICQILESMFFSLKNGKLVISPDQFDIIHSAVDKISFYISQDTVSPSEDYQPVLTQLKSILNPSKTNETVKSSPSAEKPPVDEKKKELINEDDTSEINTNIQEEKIVPEIESEEDEQDDVPLNQVTQIDAKHETIRIDAHKLDLLFLESEQLIQAKINYAQRNIEMQEFHDLVNNWREEFNKKYHHHRIKTGKEEIESRDFFGQKLNQMEEFLADIVTKKESDQRILARLVDDHLNSIKQLLMLPISTLVGGFPKIVRDLARDQGKDIELKITGNEIEVDKRILEELKDPLIHMLRNAIDHGIKKPKKSSSLNKQDTGQISIEFNSIDGRKLELFVSDNGVGINTEKIIAKATKLGLIKKGDEKKMSNQEIHDLIFNSGFSTSPLITDLSGRGLGLAIVKEKVENLGGSIQLLNNKGKGTTFHILLPLNLSTYRGVLVRNGDYLSFLPTSHVISTIRINKTQIKTVENKETILFNNEVISIARLSTVLGLQKTNIAYHREKQLVGFNEDILQILILKLGNQHLGLVVDEIINEQEILVKELGKQLKSVRNISGAAVLGSGELVPVLNVNDLMKFSSKATDSVIEEKETEVTDKTSRILVTDDSITSRTLIKDILESAGYIVETAYDGMDGFTKAAIGDFDLIVSDVDMPRMNGFEFTSKVRSDKNIGDIPVVLVTALESRDDKEHGINVGANAYIVKSSFDQSNLLDVVQKLL